MSEMTATRIVVAATLALAWLAAALLLWQTEVPDGLTLPDLDARAVFGGDLVDDNERYARLLRVLLVLSLAAQLGVLVLAARYRRALGDRVLGPPLVRAALLGAGLVAALWVVRVPFAVVRHWWRRRHDVSDLDYGSYLVGGWPWLLGQLVVAAVAAAAVVYLARRLERRAWIAAWAALVVLAAAYVLAGPLLLAPRLEPLRDERLRADIQALGAELGVDDVRVRVRRAAERTRAVNAEAVGLRPSTTVVLWDTLLRPGVGRGEVRFIAAHELAHVARHHPEKGVAWFALLALPCAWVLFRVTDLRRPSDVPLAALAAVLLAVAVSPFANAISRRYEQEADWLALRATADPASGEALFRRFARASLTDPDPPGVWHALNGTHPTLVERVALARVSRARAAAPRGGPGSP
jgi:STE24 endopeptidase